MKDRQNRLEAIIKYRAKRMENQYFDAMNKLDESLLAATKIICNATAAFEKLEEALGTESILEDFSDN